jgi:hypothetical protein
VQIGHIIGALTHEKKPAAQQASEFRKPCQAMQRSNRHRHATMTSTRAVDAPNENGGPRRGRRRRDVWSG